MGLVFNRTMRLKELPIKKSEKYTEHFGFRHTKEAKQELNELVAQCGLDRQRFHREAFDMALAEAKKLARKNKIAVG